MKSGKVLINGKRSLGKASVSIAEQRITKSDLSAPVQKSADAQSAGATGVGYALVEGDLQWMPSGTAIAMVWESDDGWKPQTVPASSSKFLPWPASWRAAGVLASTG